MSSQMGPQVGQTALAVSKNAVQRNRLVSALLQDRGAVRLITAPHGFGKTALAREYASRMFVGKEVVWVDAQTPDFLLSLDLGSPAFAAPSEDGAPDLLVLDGLPWLHEERAEVLAHAIDVLLYRGVEVIVTALPSTDCLQSLQPDRVLVRADDLLVTEQECLAAQPGGGGEAKARGIRMWKRAQSAFMGRVPAVCWGDDSEDAAGACLAAFFRENLPLSVFRCALGMLLLGHGTASDLEKLGVKPAADDAGMLLHDYPFLGMSASLLDFKAPSLSVARIKDAIAGGELVNQVCTGSVPLAERALAVLLDRGDMRRACEMLEVFCSEEHCASWLLSRGWDLLDHGQVDVVETLLSRCPDLTLSQSGALQSLRAWACGLQGDELEARHFARRVLSEGAGDGSREEAGERLMAYLALVAFDDGTTAVCGKGSYAPEEGVAGPADFLACVVDLCDGAELSSAFAPDNSERLIAAVGERKAPDEAREEALTALFTQHHDALWQSLPYRMALHILQHVDSSKLRRLLQELGCDVVVAARRKGVHRYSEALVVRDLWKSGYFGVCGPSGNKRDAALLEEAARLLKDLSAQRGAESADIPWEVGDGLERIVTGGQARLCFRDNVEVMHVRLFGSFEIVVGDRFVKESELRRKSRLLFTTLAVYQGRDVSRDALLGDLWGGLPRTRALDNFYTAWSNMSVAIGEGPYLERSGDFCRVNSRYVLSDVDEFERLTRQLLIADMDSGALLDTYAHIESLYRGDLVPSETGSHFVDVQRSRYKNMFVDSMVSASACALKNEDSRLSLWFARKAMDADSRREDVYCALIRAQMATGQRCSAIRTYLECQQFLRDELGLDPSCETEDLYQKLISTDPSLLLIGSETLGL